MRALVQRADGAQVSVDTQVVGGFEGPGLLVLLGATHTDTAETARDLASKVYRLRIFDAESLDACRPPGGPREVSAADAGLPVLVVSQFTLYGSTAKGRRPTWDAAAPAAQAEPLIAEFCTALAELGAPVTTGAFGAHMRVSATNDGPMTLWIETGAG